jgi:single-strand DNA-binding protein
MLNKAILIGRLTADPNLRYTQLGNAVANFTLAVDKPYVGQDGERGVDFIDVVVWRKLAETCANHLHKGRLVAVEGRLEIRSYDDQQGIRRKAAEVVADNVRFLDRGKEQTSSSDTDEPDFDQIPF